LKTYVHVVIGGTFEIREPPFLSWKYMFPILSVDLILYLHKKPERKFRRNAWILDSCKRLMFTGCFPQSFLVYLQNMLHMLTQRSVFWLFRSCHQLVQWWQLAWPSLLGSVTRDVNMHLSSPKYQLGSPVSNAYLCSLFFQRFHCEPRKVLTWPGWNKWIHTYPKFYNVMYVEAMRLGAKTRCKRWSILVFILNIKLKTQVYFLVEYKF